MTQSIQIQQLVTLLNKSNTTDSKEAFDAITEANLILKNANMHWQQLFDLNVASPPKQRCDVTPGIPNNGKPTDDAETMLDTLLAKPDLSPGTQSFYYSLKSSLKRFGSLTERQLTCLTKQYSQPNKPTPQGPSPHKSRFSYRSAKQSSVR